MPTVGDLVVLLSLKPVAASWAAGNNLVKKMTGAIDNLASIAGTSMLKGLVEEVLDTGDRLDILSQKTGVAAEALQELGFAAKVSGSDLESVQFGMTILGKTLEAAVKGSKEARGAFKTIGLSWRDLAKQTPEERLEAVAEAISKLPDGSKKAAAAMGVFGKSGAGLVPFLNNGAEGLRALRKEARESGAVISNESVAALAEAGDEIDKIKMITKGFVAQIVVGLLPALRGAVDAVSEFLAENRELIKLGIGGVIEGVSLAFGALGDAVSTVTDLFGGFGEQAEIVEAAATALGIALVAVAVKAAIAWAAALLPFVAIGAAITGVILIVRKLRRDFGSVTNAIGTALDRAWSAIKSFGRRVDDFFFDVGEAIASPFVAAFEAVRGVISDMIDWVRARWQDVKDIANEIAEWFNSTPKFLDPKFYEQLRAQQQQGSNFITDRVGKTAPSVSVTAPLSLTVTVPPGSDAAAIGGSVKAELDGWWERTIRQAAAGAGVR